MSRKRVVITGSSGLVGSRLVPALQSANFDVLRLVRRQPAAPGEVFWDPAQGEIDAAALEGLDAAVNLAGVSIAGKRWTESRKEAIRYSRIQASSLLAHTLATLHRPPSVLVSTSAVGYYGDGGDALLTEAAPKGEGFLADVCEQWEAAALPAQIVGIRVVHPRFGIVLAREGGLLSPLVKLFKLGLGGRIAHGNQYMSWIDIDDLVRLLITCASDSRLSGPVNAVALEPITNSEFTRALGNMLHRPTILPVPAFAIKVALGEMGEELVLASQRAVPVRLSDLGFEFHFPTVSSALSHQLGAARPAGASAPTVRTARA